MTNLPTLNLPQSPLTYQGQPVAFTRQLAQYYGCAEGVIRKNHTKNKERFQEGAHYFKIENGELTHLRKLSVTIGNTQMIGNAARHAVIWTKKGAARHAKMLTTEKAWDVFEMLEEAYFNQATVKESSTVPAACHEVIAKVMTENGELRNPATTKQAGEILKVLRAIDEKITTLYAAPGQAAHPFKAPYQSAWVRMSPRLQAVCMKYADIEGCMAWRDDHYRDFIQEASAALAADAISFGRRNDYGAFPHEARARTLIAANA